MVDGKKKYKNMGTWIQFICALEREILGLCRNNQLLQILGPLFEKPGRIFILTKQVFKMAEIEEVEV